MELACADKGSIVAKLFVDLGLPRQNNPGTADRFDVLAPLVHPFVVAVRHFDSSPRRESVQNLLDHLRGRDDVRLLPAIRQVRR
ncbi:hypothetical protein MMMB2_4042 [Mycobacterium marinum MB2]|nr:hypothetical protein MMMB2_4042 [Mycobacterium marinum MB2]